MEERRPANIDQRGRRDRESTHRNKARKGAAHVLDKAWCSFTLAGSMCSAQRLIVTEFSALVPLRWDAPIRPAVVLATPPFLTVPKRILELSDERTVVIGTRCACTRVFEPERIAGTVGCASGWRRCSLHCRHDVLGVPFGATEGCESAKVI